MPFLKVRKLQLEKKGISKPPLDMSHAARMGRAKSMGFDPADRWYRGSTADEAESRDITWMSKDPKLASDYSTAQYINRGGARNVAELMHSATKPLDADAMPKTLTLPVFADEILKQMRKRGDVDSATVEKMEDRVRIAKQAAAREESGPHYSRHDFWYAPSMMFGADGAAAINDMLQMSGFDSIAMTEQGARTLGVIGSDKVRSVNAAFDPEFSGSSNRLRAELLAASLPAGVMMAADDAEASMHSDVPVWAADGSADHAPAPGAAEERAKVRSPARQALEAYRGLAQNMVAGIMGDAAQIGGMMMPWKEPAQARAAADDLADSMMYRPEQPNPYLDAIGEGVERASEQVTPYFERLKDSPIGRGWQQLPERLRGIIESTL